MQYVIDGYNFLFWQPGRGLCDDSHTIGELVQLPLAQARMQVIEYISDMAISSGHHISLVFDASKTPGDASWQRYSPIHVIYSPQDMSADDYMLERCIYAGKEALVCIVTNDKKLRHLALTQGGLALSFEQFFKKVKKGKKRTAVKQSISPTSNRPTKTPKWHTHYIDLFEKRYFDLSQDVIESD